MAKKKHHAKKKRHGGASSALSKKVHALSTKVHNLEIRKLDKKKFRKAVKKVIADTSPNVYAHEADYG